MKFIKTYKLLKIIELIFKVEFFVKKELKIQKFFFFFINEKIIKNI